MKRLLSTLCLAGYFWSATNAPMTLVTTGLSIPAAHANQIKEASSELSYLFYGQSIPLVQRPNTVAVALTTGRGTPRGRTFFQQFQEDLQEGSRSRNVRSTTKIPISVTPVGENYALIELPSEAARGTIVERAQEQPYVAAILPVLSRSQDGKPSGETVLLQNEIVVSFEPNLSNSQQKLLLNRYGLDVVRPLRFTQNRYIVRSKSDLGIGILQLTNRLNRTSGVKSATPNFVQVLSYNVEQLDDNASSTDRPDARQQIDRLLKSLPTIADIPFPATLLPLQWHLNSTLQRGRFLPRTDVRATEAWKISNGGRDTVVAVIDSLIQWDHPDLATNLYTVEDTPNTLPGEVHGWDFSSENGGDPDTRISDIELAQIRPIFQDTFQLSNAQMLQRYNELAAKIKEKYPQLSDTQIATWMRRYLRNTIASEFHGTWVAGVIAARPQSKPGTIVGVAPNTKVLPIRVFGLNGQITTASLIEAIGYAAERNVDVINMSLGGLLPDQELTDQIFQILDSHPNLIIVASAGNESLDGVGFPAAIPGVVSVGATNKEGRRSLYSSYGGRLDVVAPGGETHEFNRGGILTTGGIGIAGFWQDMDIPAYSWGVALDPAGDYVQVQGTSFSAPIVSGVLALMQGENQGRRVDRTRLISILKQTASYEGLAISQADANQYRLQAAIGFGTAQDFPFVRPSGIFTQPQIVSMEQYYFGKGLVNAEAAVREVQQAQ